MRASHHQHLEFQSMLNIRNIGPHLERRGFLTLLAAPFVAPALAKAAASKSQLASLGVMVEGMAFEIAPYHPVDASNFSFDRDITFGVKRWQDHGVIYDGIDRDSLDVPNRLFGASINADGDAI
jgi:hypothetical protein